MDAESIEEKNGMKEVYEECRKLAWEFYDSLKYSYPTHRVDGEVFISGNYVHDAERRKEEYYLKCLDERSYRVPLNRSETKRQKTDT